MIWTEEDIEKVRKFIEIKRRGHYAETHELTSVYNRVLEKHVNNTTCGSCLRQRVEELERALRQYEADKAKKEAEKLAQTIKEHEEAVEELTLKAELESKGFLTEEEENNNVDIKEPHKTKGRKKKQESAG